MSDKETAIAEAVRLSPATIKLKYQGCHIKKEKYDYGVEVSVLTFGTAENQNQNETVFVEIVIPEKELPRFFEELQQTCQGLAD